MLGVGINLWRTSITHGGAIPDPPRIAAFRVTAPIKADAGVSFSFTVQAIDQHGAAFPSYAGTVHFTSTDPAAILPANAALSAGAGTFPATLQAGNFTISATDTLTPTLKGTSAPIEVAVIDVPPPVVEEFPPTIDGVPATFAADFVTNQGTYWVNGAEIFSFALWVAGIGGVYSRASAATYMQGGVLKTAAAGVQRLPTDLAGVAQGVRLTGPVTNKALHSNDFTVAPWGYVTSVVSVSGVGPDRVSPAYKITDTTADARHYVYQRIIGYAAGKLTQSVFMKAKEHRYGYLSPTNAGTVDAATIVFDLTTGEVTSTSLSNNPTNLAYGSIPLADGWFLLWVSFDTTAGDGYLQFGPCNTAVPVIASNQPQWAGDGVSGVLAFGAQCTLLPILADYVPTTTVEETQAADNLNFPYSLPSFSALVGTNHIEGNGGAVLSPSSWRHIYAADRTHFSVYGAASVGGPAITDITNPHKTMVAGDTSNVWITSDGFAPNTVAGPLTYVGPTHLYVGNDPGSPGSFLYGNISLFAMWDSVVAPPAEMLRLTALPPLPFEPVVGTIPPSSYADFTTPDKYSYRSKQFDFAGWLTAIGGTFSRGSTATYLDRGVVKTAAMNVPRFPTALDGTPLGIRLTGGVTNVIPWSQDLSHWTFSTTGLSGVGGVADPAGGNTAWTVTALAAGQPGWNYVFAMGSATGTLRASLWVRRRTGTGPVNLAAPDGNSVVPIALTAQWQRFSTSGPDGGGNCFIQVDVETLGDQVDVWNGQVTATNFLADDIVTTGTTMSQAADILGGFPYAKTTFSAMTETNGMGNGMDARVIGIEYGYLTPISNSNNVNFAASDNLGVVLNGQPVDFLARNKTMTVADTVTGWITSNGAVPNTGPLNIVSSVQFYLGSTFAGSAFSIEGNLSKFAVWDDVVAPPAEMQRLTA